MALELLPVEGYQGISFNQITQVQNQQFKPGEVVARHKNDRLFDKRSFSVSLPISNKDEVHEFLLSKRGNIPFKFGYDGLAYTCNEYSFTYLATGDRANNSDCYLAHQFEAVFTRENNLIAEEGYANPYPDNNPTFNGSCRIAYYSIVKNLLNGSEFIVDGGVMFPPLVVYPYITYTQGISATLFRTYLNFTSASNGLDGRIVSYKAVLGSNNGEPKGKYEFVGFRRWTGFFDNCGEGNSGQAAGQVPGKGEGILYSGQFLIHKSLSQSRLIKIQNFYGAFQSFYRTNTFDANTGLYKCQLGFIAKDVYGAIKSYEVDSNDSYTDDVYRGKIFVLSIIKLSDAVDLGGTFSVANQFGTEDNNVIITA